MNPRRAAPQGPKPCAFDLTRPPPHSSEMVVYVDLRVVFLGLVFSRVA